MGDRVQHGRQTEMNAGALALATGERDAVRNNTGLTVSHSVPGLAVGPSIPPTTGRTPEARPPVLTAEGGIPCQPKSVPGCGAGSSTENCEREALASNELDDIAVSELIHLFQLLDEWDRGPHAAKTM
jgi:hypothetical protein